MPRFVNGSDGSEPLPYIPALDGVRAVAVILVILYHLRASFDHTYIAKLLHCGWVGVDLFFALSGFLITRLLLAAKGKPHYFKNFYKKRALRIWPLYYSLVGVAVLYALHVGKVSSVSWWAYLTFTQNLFIAGFGIELLRMTWSLAIEEQFYLVWPLAVRYTSRLGVGVAGALICLTEPLVRLLILRSHPPIRMYLSTLTHLDGIMLGSLLALWVTSPGFNRGRARIWLCIAMAVGVAGTVFSIVPTEAAAQTSPLLYTCLALASVGMIGLCALGAMPGSAVLELKPMRYIGTISYGLYLLHIQTFDAVDKAMAFHHPPPGILVAIKLLCALAVASCSWHWFESRMIRRGHQPKSGEYGSRVALGSDPDSSMLA